MATFMQSPEVISKSAYQGSSTETALITIFSSKSEREFISIEDNTIHTPGDEPIKGQFSIYNAHNDTWNGKEAYDGAFDLGTYVVLDATKVSNGKCVLLVGNIFCDIDEYQKNHLFHYDSSALKNKSTIIHQIAIDSEYPETLVCDGQRKLKSIECIINKIIIIKH